MPECKVHTIESAPEKSKRLLQSLQTNLGFVPNTLATLSESPEALKGYLSLAGLFEQTSLSAVERHIVFLTSSYENRCGYCMAAHSTIAKGAKVPDDIIQALRSGEPLPDPKLEGLRQFVSSVIRKLGWVREEEVEELKELGYGRQQILEILLGITMKTLTNYLNHIMEPPLDQEFEGQAWDPT